jgi:MYXO-CTERM domain-containing protein
MRDLGTLGGTTSAAKGIDGNVVIGNSTTASGKKVGFYDNVATGHMVDINTLINQNDAFISGVQDFTIIDAAGFTTQGCCGDSIAATATYTLNGKTYMEAVLLCDPDPIQQGGEGPLQCSAGAGGGPTPVAEPSTLAAFGVGVVALAGLRHRRRRHDGAAAQGCVA